MRWQSTGYSPVQDQGEQILSVRRTFGYAAMTKDEAQRRYWTFYEAIKGLKGYNMTPDFSRSLKYP